MSSFKEEHSGWIKRNLDTGASVTAIPVHCKPNAEAVGDSSRTASGELIKIHGPGMLQPQSTARNLLSRIPPARVQLPFISLL